MKLNSGHKIIITVSLLALVAAAIVALIIVPMADNIRQIAQATYNLRSYMEKKYRDSLRSRVTAKQIETVKQATAGYQRYLFNKQDALKLIQHLETIAEQNKMSYKINSSNLDKISAGERLEINISANGAYGNTLAYINALENSSYFLNVQDIRLSPVYDRGGQVSGDAIANITLIIYVYK